jgi:hypothetical protein
MGQYLAAHLESKSQEYFPYKRHFDTHLVPHTETEQEMGAERSS